MPVGGQRAVPILAAAIALFGVGSSSAAYLLRFEPPLGYCQRFGVDVKGSAEARGDKVDFSGYLDLSQTVVEVPEDKTQPVKVQLVLNGGSIRYNDEERPPRYIGSPFTAVRTRLGVITDVSEPLDDDDRTGIDVTAAVLYSTSLLALPERDTRPGRTWDGSHDAFDPYGDYVPVTAENTFADLIELPDATLIDVDSKGSFPYRAVVDDRPLQGTLEFMLVAKMNLATGTLAESDLKLWGSLVTKAGPLKSRVSITVHELRVRVTELEHYVIDPEDLPTSVATSSHWWPAWDTAVDPSPCWLRRWSWAVV